VSPRPPDEQRTAGRGDPRKFTRDSARAKRHWARNPAHNYGVATGEPFGIVVLEANGEEGKESLRARFADRPMPHTVAVSTPKGLHLYFKTNGEHIRTSIGELGPGLNVFGDDWYVVGAGSKHPGGHVYRYIDGHAPASIRIASAPPFLLELPRRPPASPQLARTDAATAPRPIVHLPYGDAPVAGNVRRLADKSQSQIALDNLAPKPDQPVRFGYIGEPEVPEQSAEAGTGVGLAPDEIESTKRAEGGGTGQQYLASSALVSNPIEEQASAPDEDALAIELAKLGCTDADNADRFVRRYGTEFVCCPEGDWLYWDGKSWRLDLERRRELRARDTARQIAAEVPFLQRRDQQEQRTAHAQRSLAKPALDRMIEMAAPMLMVSLEKLDASPWLLNVANGTLNLQTGALQPHDPRDLITKLAPVNYDPAAKAPVFGRFMHGALKGDLRLFRYLQRFCGYSLTGSTIEQVLFYFLSRQSNEESTFVLNFREMLGDYATHTSPEMLLVKVRGDNPNDLARLKGTRMATASEAPPGKQLDESRIKSMMRGNSITARFMRRESFSFKPEFKLWVMGNAGPRLRSADDALWPLIRVIPFEIKTSVGERDLLAKLRAEWPGILAWAVRGCLAWQRSGLQTPRAVHEATASYRKRADHLSQFIPPLLPKQGALTAASILYRAYVDRCAAAHERPLGMREFKRQLEDRGYEHARVKSGSVWRDIVLRR
jgi:putative DNA primase/helicase